MAELHVRNIPPELHEQLREQARSEGRSMSAEAIVLLRRGVEHGSGQRARQQDAIERLREVRQRSHLPEGAAPAEEIVRADRAASR